MAVNTKSFTDRKQINTSKPLSRKEEAFCHYYVETHRGTESAIRAGYSEKNAVVRASYLLSKSNVQDYIQKLQQEIYSKNIASAEEVMNYFTQVMRGQINDQFNLEASLSERTKAAQELARRTVDMQNRQNGQADAVVSIKLDWGED